MEKSHSHPIMNGATAMLLTSPMVKNKINDLSTTLVSKAASVFAARFPRIIELAERTLDTVEAKLEEYNNQKTENLN